MSTTRRAVYLAVITASLVAASSVRADDPPGSTATLWQRTSKNQGIFGFDYGVPASPALNLLNLSPGKTVQSTSLKPFVISVPSLFAGSGGQSVAFDFAPAWVLQSSDEHTLYHYLSSPIIRLFDRARLGIAAYNGDSAGCDPKKANPSLFAA